jgi:thiol-disulfide isomerase/thioredoxin
MPLAIASQMPVLSSSVEWLNGSADAESYTGHPMIIQFWAVSCPICKDNIPKLQQFLETYRGQGLRLVSVHMPRMEADMDVERVKAAVEEMGLTGPCAVDNAHAIGDRFQTGGVWPCYFLFDAEGKLRSRAAGAMGLMMAENSLKRLLDLGTKL